MSTINTPIAGTNLTILVGVLSRDAERRTLPSGEHLVHLEVTVRPHGEHAESVPVAWFAAPEVAATWEKGEEVLVTGRVRRRFFKAAGATQSRTEVAASRVVPTRRKAAAGKALEAAMKSVSARL
jgi:single-strand DNA-binding protein